MKKTIKLILAAAVICAGFGINSLAFGQTTGTADAIAVEASVTAQDLEVSDPILTPASPFYFLKEWSRGVQSFFAFGQLKKAELEQKFANEKLIELKKLADEGKVNSDVLKKATDKYKKAMEKIKAHTDKIKENASDNADVNKFLEKFANQQVLQEKIMQKLEGQVPADVLQKIKDAREAHLERFKDVMTKLESNKDRIAEKIKNALQNGDATNPEILEKIKNKMPDDVKQKLRDIEEGVREKVNTKLIEKATTNNGKKECPLISKPEAGFCKNGIVKVKRDQKGCVAGFECLIPSAKPKTSCAKDSDCPQIYCIKAPCPQNKCISGQCELVNTEKACTMEAKQCPDGSYVGRTGPNCEFSDCPTASNNEGSNSCRELWWFDKTTKACGQKKFCGAYMYFGLQTFETQEACKSALSQ